MTKTGMFNTDLETVFTSNSIEEIEKLSQGLKHDIDQKREELRTMVGERYRDLMEAADTISQMKSSSEHVIDNMKKIIRSSNDLQSMSFNRKSETRSTRNRNRETAGYEDEDDTIVTDDVIDDRMVSVAAQIKLLTDSPEKMWSAVEHNDFLTATQLYLFARHVHTSLSTCDVDGSLVATFPVIERQWAAVAHFNDAIYDACQHAIGSPDTDPDKVVEAMASMFFLRGITSPSLMLKLLASREASLKEFLLHHESRSAKTFIGQTSMSIVSCVRTVHKAFVMQQDGISYLESIISDVSCRPTLDLFQSTGLSSFSSPVMKHLPNIVREFCPSIVSVTATASTLIKTTPMHQKVDIELVKNECTQWLDRIHDFVSERTASILEHVKTISGLSLIRKAIYQRLKDEIVSSDWDSLCLETLQRKMNLWDEFYRNIFLDRVETLIEIRMTEMSQLVLTELGKSDLNEADTFAFIWSEVGLNDLNLSKPGFGLNDNENNQLCMKTKAFSPHIQNVCKKLNLTLQKLLNELYEYVDNGDKASASIADPLAFLNDRNVTANVSNEPFSLTIDNETILKFSQKTCFESVEIMVSEIGRSKGNNKNNLTNFVEVGRFFSAVTELCPALQKCVEAAAPENESTSTRSMQTFRGTPEWNSVKKILEEESYRYFVLWVGQLIAVLKLDLSHFLTDNFGTWSLAEWESSEISEEAEDGSQVRSVIRVPQNVSIGLHSALCSFVHRAYAAGPHALPQQVQLSLTQECAAAIVNAYFEYSDQRKLMQDVALQLHFDVQFLLQCVVGRDNRTLSTSVTETLASLEKHIDPFDLSVFSSFMSENVKRCVVRNQTVFGVLIPSDRFSLFASMKFSNERSGSGEQQHNVIRMTSSPNFRFPLLPVTSISGKPQQRSRGRQPRDAMTTLDVTSVSASRSATLAVQQPPTLSSRSSSSSSTSRRRSKSPATVKNTTASFFGSMSSSWFGTGK